MTDTQVEQTESLNTSSEGSVSFSQQTKPVESNLKQRKHKFKKPCWICRQGKLLIDYKDVDFLKNYLKRYNKILIHKISGNCLKHQHQLTQAIKRARYIGLLPFVAD